MTEGFDINMALATTWAKFSSFQRKRIVQVVAELKQPPWPAETYTRVMNSVAHISTLDGPLVNGLILEVYERRLT